MKRPPVQRFSCLLLGVPLLLMQACVLAAEEQPVSIKAKYLYNLAQFVEWPTALSSTQSFQLCVLGDDIIAELRNIVANVEIGGSPIQVVNAKSRTALTECRMLYIDAAENWRISAVMTLVGQNPTLTVSDVENFCQLGGMIGLVRAGDRIRFEVGLKAAVVNRLKISSRILSMAEKVY